MILLNEYIEVAGKIKDTVSEFIPDKLSVMIKLAELAFDTFGKVDDSLNSLYKKAFKEAVEFAAKDENLNSICELLNNCKEISSLEDVQNLTDYLKKTNMQMGLYLSENDILSIAEKIGEKFNIILLEDKYDTLYKYFLLWRNPNNLSNLNNDIRDIKEILNEIYDRIYQVENDNKSYAKNFVKPLFRNSKNIIITLKDLFIVQDITTSKNEIPCKITDFICNFIICDDYDVLFIEGCGGYGKSSIVSFLTYNYIFNIASKDFSFLKDFYLEIIRLRDIQGDDKISVIKKRLDNKYSIASNIILIFDGLDELCMTENISGSQIAMDIIKTFYCYKKIIITTRQTYVDYRRINSLGFDYEIAEVCCFDEEQRIRYATLFEEKDKTHIEALEYVKNLPLEKQQNENIYGSPFLLYLILSGGINEEEKENSWLLMHRLFHDELFNPPYGYDRMIDEETAEIIYQFNCDIAYEMFKTKNQKLFMTTTELKELLPNSDIKDIVKKSHGLFSYMRKTSSGMVEFVHNHIRDYFLCEKILREINLWYTTELLDGYQIALNLGKLLNYDYFTSEVKLFIKEAIKYSNSVRCDLNRQYKDNYDIYGTLLDRCDSIPLSYVFDWFYKSGGAVKYEFNNSNDCNYKSFSKIVVNNSSYIYRTVYKLILNEDKYLRWFSDEMLKSTEMNSIYDCFNEYID